MRLFLLPFLLVFASCANIPSNAQNVELSGKLIKSYVGTRSGLKKGYILTIKDIDSINIVSDMANTLSFDPRYVLVKHNDKEQLEKFNGEKVLVKGALYPERADIFHTDFVIRPTTILEAERTEQWCHSHITRQST